jgi:hypothetical protein
MRKIEFNPDELEGDKREWWDSWSRRANEHLKKARREASAHTFNQGIWRDLKDWLLENVFNGKCAYCESLVEAGFYGDGEHYRPKGNVKVDGKEVTVGGKPHPGYYWLVYHWKNLVPSCQKCNSGKGKQTQFPIAGTYIIAPRRGRNDPDALDVFERPLLLHPYIDQAERHLVFGANGVITAKENDARGAATITVCDLTRQPLCDARKTAQEDAWPRFLMHLWKGTAAEFWEKEKTKTYFAAVRAYLVIMYQQRGEEILNA